MSHKATFWASLISIAIIPVIQTATNAFTKSDNQQLTNIAQNNKVKPDKYLTLAVNKYRQGNYQAAVTNLDRAIKLKPDYAVAYDFRGLIKYQNLKDFSGALADFDRALGINPNLVTSYYNRGLLKYKKLNDRPGGIADMREAVKLFESQGDRESAQDAIEFLKQWGATGTASGS